MDNWVVQDLQELVARQESQVTLDHWVLLDCQVHKVHPVYQGLLV